jgi:hypothetical protein
MKSFQLIFRGLWIFSIAIGVLITMNTKSQTAPQPADPKPIHVNSLMPVPIGFLGIPLGSVVRVTGEVIDGDTLRLKAASGYMYLRINTVDGRKLESAVDFQFPDHKYIPKSGSKFDYYVHETGEFGGIVQIPKESGIKNITPQGTMFGYQPKLVIHKNNMK